MSLQGLFHVLQSMPAYQRLSASLTAGQGASTVVPDAAKPYLLGALWQQLHRPMLVVCPRPDDTRRLIDQLFAYCGDDAPIFSFAESELLPYEHVAPDPATIHQRLSALGALRSTGQEMPPIIVASAMSLMQKTIAPDMFDSLVHTIRAGERIGVEPLLQQWARLGYRSVPTIEDPGTMSRRGGIIDIYTPGLPMPARIDLWGDRIDSIRLFDPASQRSLQPVPSLTVLPAQEVLPAFNDSTALEQLVQELDFSQGKSSERDQLEGELAELVAGFSPDNAAFYGGFFNSHTLLDHVPAGGHLFMVVCEPHEVEEAAKQWEASTEKLRWVKQERGNLPGGFPSPIRSWEASAGLLEHKDPKLEITRYHQASAASSSSLPFGPAPSYLSDLDQLTHHLRAGGHGQVVMGTYHSQRLTELLKEAGLGVEEHRTIDDALSSSNAHVVHRAVAQGWTLRADEEATPLLTLLSDAELFGTVKQAVVRSRSRAHPHLEREELSPGQYVVHIDHGIARFSGVTRMPGEGTQQEYLVLEYAQGDKLYVPMEQMGRLSPYLSGGDGPPTLSRLGTQEWGRSVARAKESTKRLAFDLLQLYAQRETAEGHAFAPDTPWQREMEDAFPFVETPDQSKAIGTVKEDMERITPMDRLVCGDVGYGKTEVALRAAFKAVMDGMQVALLVPTTILAQQHYVTFTERLEAFPLRVEVLSRFRTDQEQRQVVAGLQRGEVDIVIGTHRLLQKDVAFKDLGLVIIDEEHRFGVGHKEQFRNMRREVDVLTMTATPIPRTLHMAMAGIRDISSMETPPEHRHPINTYLAETSDDLVREAILRELDRGGQVFYLHNRVKSIDLAAEWLQQLVPEARAMVAHGQMPEELLAQTMAKFAAGSADVLLCTTIIESGLDLPNVNTLIVERADRFGLAQLYQLRGRIGRRASRAYTYLLVPRGRRITDTAHRRLQTVLAATELGAGFRIALKDLEIRGAGNILGPEQSGHIHAVGYDLYARLLAEAVSDLRTAQGGAPASARSTPDPQVDLGLPAFIPEWLVEHLPTRMDLYQRMAQAKQLQEVDELAQELPDRFGQIPDEVHHLLYALRVRALARLARVESITKLPDHIILKLLDPIGGARLPLSKALGHNVQVGHQQVHFPLNAAASTKAPEAATAVPWGQGLLEVLERLQEFQRRLPGAVGHAPQPVRSARARESL